MRYLLLLVVGVISTGSVRAQITITETNLLPFGRRAFTISEFTSSDPARFAPLTLLRGGPHVFDFRGTYGSAGMFGSAPTTCTSTLPGCDDPRLSAATAITRISGDSVGTFVEFADLDASGFRTRGFAARDDFDPASPGDETVKAVNIPAALTFALPLQFGRMWNSTYKIELSLNGSLVAVQDLSERSEVVSYGTLTTPAGSSEALVIRKNSVTATSFAGQTFVDTTTVYTFLTQGGSLASITTDAQGRVVSADYSVATLTLATERVAGSEHFLLEAPVPNPAQSSTRIAFSLNASQAVRVSVHDLLGREMAVVAEGTYAAGRHEMGLDAGRLAPGAYLIRLAGKGLTRTQVLSVAR